MKNVTRFALIAALSIPFAALAGTPQPAAASGAAAHFSPDSYHVFVDLPTGYMFVKTPFGWKFRGQLAAERYPQLPVGTSVSLVPNAQVSAPELARSEADQPLRISQR